MKEDEEGKIGCSRYETESFHVDFTGHLAWGVLGNELLNCADEHAEQRGFGMTCLRDNRYTWVLSRLVIEMERMPRQYERFCIRTWVENVYRLFTDRNYEIVSAEGEVLGYARSIWAMIDMDTRKPQDLLALHGGRIAEYVCDKECPIARPGRIRVRSEVPVRTFRARYGDIDLNGHVNSVKYIEHMLDLFPLSRFEQCRVRRLEVAYHAESYYDDTLSFYREEAGEGVYDIEVRKESGDVRKESSDARKESSDVRKEGGDVVCRAKVIFI